MPLEVRRIRRSHLTTILQYLIPGSTFVGVSILKIEDIIYNNSNVCVCGPQLALFLTIVFAEVRSVVAASAKHTVVGLLLRMYMSSLACMNIKRQQVRSCRLVD